MNNDIRIQMLVVDDQESIRKLCVAIGTSLGFDCVQAESAEAALAKLETTSPDIVLSDLRMPNMSGLDFLDRVRTLLPRTELVIMTGHGSIESAVQAMKLGAYDYITKPFRVEELKLVLQRMEEKVRLVVENQFLRERVSSEMELNGIVGSSTRIQDVLRMVARLKDTRTPVLITGESGTGKELVARAIHYRGSLAQRPFVAVDCGSLVPTLIESELFGYEKGAFTGATKSKVGLFQAANGGTIFLDEIGELPLEMQAKLLRVLQEKEVRPVGSNQKAKVDVRIIAATNRDLEAAYREGSFRKDLYFRLNVVTVHLPALRERRSDIPMLVHAFLKRACTRMGKAISGLTEEAMERLLTYAWPGNIRELENVIERAVILSRRANLGVEDLPDLFRANPVDLPRTNGGGASLVDSSADAEPSLASIGLKDSLKTPERDLILKVLEEVRWNRSKAAKRLGIHRSTLYHKMRQLGIDE